MTKGWKYCKGREKVKGAGSYSIGSKCNVGAVSLLPAASDEMVRSVIYYASNTTRSC